jgi:hypothetical protein
MIRRKAPQVKACLSRIARELAPEGTSSAQIVRAFVKDKNYEKLIDDESADILQIGLLKLANDMCAVRRSGRDEAQLDIFGVYPMSPILSWRAADGSGVHKKAREYMNLDEMKDFLSAHARRTKPQSKNQEIIGRLVSDCENLKLAGTATATECWAAIVASKGPE